MRAVHVTRLDGPEAVEIVDLPQPTAPDGQLLIQVARAGVSFPDLLLTRGEYQIRPDLPFVPGAEVSGTVVSAPADSGFTAGDRVAAFPGFGGFAEFATASTDFVFPLPDDMSFDVAAALPMNYLTCLFGLLQRGGLQAGETVLVHGAAGGIGTAAIQVAKASGATVIAVTSTPEKGEVARAAGADEVVAADGFLAAVKDLTGGRGVDIIVDPVGGDRFTDSLRSLATLGRLLVIGFTHGEIPQVKVNRLLLNNVSVVGVGWGAYWASRPHVVRAQWDQLMTLAGTGAIDPPIDQVLPLSDAGTAIGRLGTRTVTGKLLLDPTR
ncbi:NADPH:quinone oxidoreductase family protein [Branchiibius sp. NY16-3462-2]|uniref:NADPH:quinone oxidoreductase family protein n=1 Tax=Branchiibius sp. NY16-3462-2 TaxID=1807500 RepID=UPI0007986114|nr:NADPH:quinone oxidoreductase family protein [Branchiibius sp. NY16-3462-2]KYH43927.1 NADPH:quinone oxidoreductase [Branchiibius sp. NY16-3462-2]